MKSLLILLALSANLKPAEVANLVMEKDAAALVEPLRASLTSSDALTRATAARVIAIRDIKPLVADLRAAVEHEADGTAAREELRGIAILGDAADVDFAIATSAKWPQSMNADVANAVARRGAAEALDLYFSKLRNMPGLSRKEFFRIALWGQPGVAKAAAPARILGLHDAAAWRDLIDVLRESEVELSPGVAVAALNSSSEEVRNDIVWHLLRRFAGHPEEMPQLVREALEKPVETTSDREAFGRELVRRLLGGERKEEPRWKAWVETKEADDLLGYDEPEVYALLSDQEFALRKSHCGELPVECAMPKSKPPRGRIVHATAVRPQELVLPGALPAGLGKAIASRCPEPWFGLAGVSVDNAGRVNRVDLSRVQGHCTRQIETLLRLSYATNTSIASSHSSDDVILSHAKGTDLCLDEAPPSNGPPAPLARAGGKIVAPKVRHRVEPVYPGNLLGSASARGSSLVIMMAMITREGCVRNVRILAQSPFPELNTAAIYAVSQWTFDPGTLDGKPVDVLYNLTINFKQ